MATAARRRAPAKGATAKRRTARPAPAKAATTAKSVPAKTRKVPAKQDVTDYATKPATDYHKAFAKWGVQVVGIDLSEMGVRTAFLKGIQLATAARPQFMQSDFLAEWREATGQAKRGPKSAAEKTAPPRKTRKVAEPVEDEFEDDDDDDFEDEDAEDVDDDDFEDESEEDDDEDEDDFEDDDDEDEDDEEDFEDDDDEEEEPPPPAKTRRRAPAKAAPAKRGRPAAKAPVKGRRAPAKKAASSDDDEFIF